MGAIAVEHTLLELERRGGVASTMLSTRVALVITLSSSRPNGSVILAVVRDVGPALADGTPLRAHPDGGVLLDADGSHTVEPSGYDALGEAGVRDELIQRDWKVDGAELRKEWLVHDGPDRLALRVQIEDLLNAIGSGADPTLDYKAPGSDGGFAQVGCMLTFAAAAVAGVIGMIVIFVVEGLVDPVAGGLGLIGGWIVGCVVTAQSLTPALRVRRLRPHAEGVAILAGPCASGPLAVIVTVIFGLDTI